MGQFLKSFAKNESGATAIEYGLIAGILAVGILAFMPLLINGLTTMFTGLGTVLTNNNPAG